MTDTSKKKISLQEAIKQQLERKKAQSSSDQSNRNMNQSTKKLSTQSNKKINNQRRRTGV
ncbi:hypothetical protein [Bacillus solitudinis]|uniref:hypothetical protein n=1 Tax=Bacillus solitudinis TaxID=2014074 RepID=UPI000C247712|nr:hypothetical protein [Bacillus solitudinis]